jgi:SAM-dependent methyltransferase
VIELTTAELAQASASTLEHYERSALSFWEATRTHDVSQNITALLQHLRSAPPCKILDLGCGPGRDLIHFRSLGHEAVGLDGAPSFVRLAQQHSGCEVLHQNLLQLDLPDQHFDGVFANAVLFHVPSQELPRVLSELHRTLTPGGVLFCSNPHGPDREQYSGLRYGCYLSWPTWRSYVLAAGFVELEHYYRPSGLSREHQPWLASLWRKPAESRNPSPGLVG